jgi:hypothetical protein
MREAGSQVEASIDAAIESGELSVSEAVTWSKAEGHVKARIRLQHPSESGFFVELQQSRIPERFTLQLVYKKNPARRFCSTNPHTQALDCAESPGMRLPGRHKHRWSDVTGDECVYMPEDISGVLIEEVFHEFCSECGITFLGVWHDPPIQPLMETLR